MSEALLLLQLRKRWRHVLVRKAPPFSVLQMLRLSDYHAHNQESSRDREAGALRMSGMRYAAAVIAAAAVVFGTTPNYGAEKNPLLGKWVISNAAIAPWIDEASMPELGAQAKKYVGLTILFTKRTVL